MHTDIRNCPQVQALTDALFSFQRTVCLNSRIPNHGGKCTSFLQNTRAAADRRRGSVLLPAQQRREAQVVGLDGIAVHFLFTGAVLRLAGEDLLRTFDQPADDRR